MSTSLYSAFRTRRLHMLQNAARGPTAEDAKRHTEREEALQHELLGTSERNVSMAALHVAFSGPHHEAVHDVDMLLAHDGTDALPMPDVLQVLANLTASRQKWRPDGCVSLSVHASDLRLGEDPLADEDDTIELDESMLPRLFGYGLRHFELAGTAPPKPAAGATTAIQIVTRGLHFGRQTLRTVALRRVGLERDEAAFEALLRFLRCNTVLRHLDLSGNGLDESQQARVRMALDTPLSCVSTLIFDKAETQGRGVHRLTGHAHAVTVALPDFLDGRLADLEAGAAAGRPEAEALWKRVVVAVSGDEFVALDAVPGPAVAQVLLPPGPHAGKTALVEWVRRQLKPAHDRDVTVAPYPCHLHETCAVQIDDGASKDLARLVKAGVLSVFGGETNEVTVKPTTLEWARAWRRRAVNDEALYSRAYETRVAAYRTGRSGAVAVECVFDLQLQSYKQRQVVGTEVTDGKCLLLFDHAAGDRSWQSHVAVALAKQCVKRGLVLEVFEKKKAA